jgi:hypothetical protein
MVTLNLKCSKHPNYKAKRDSVSCLACKAIYGYLRGQRPSAIQQSQRLAILPPPLPIGSLVSWDIACMDGSRVIYERK